MNDIIENIINEAVEAKPKEPEVKTEVETNEPVVEVEAKPEAVEAQDDNSEVETETKEPVGEPEEEADAESEEDTAEPKDEFPSKAKTALKRVRQEAKKRRLENRELKKQVEALQAQIEASKVDSKEAPKEEDFDSYNEYLKAEMDVKVQNGLAENQNRQAQEQLTSKQEQLKQAQAEERAHHMASKYIAAKEAYSDYDKVLLEDNGAIIESMPEYIEDYARMIDDAPTAFYVLAKEGKLEQLAYVDPQVALVELMQAQYRKPVTANAEPKKTVSAAPKPIKSVKGTGTKSKQLHQMSPDELLKLVN